MLTLSTTNVACANIIVLTSDCMDRYHHGNLKDVLIRAAFRLVAKSGLDRFTLRELARKAGVSHNAPYRHFRSKEDLVAALAAEAFRQLTASLRAAMASAGNPGEKLRDSAIAYLRFALQNPSRFQVMFHASFDRMNYPEYIAAYEETLAVVEGLVRNCGWEDTETATSLVWSSVHGIVELGLSGRLYNGDPAELERLTIASVGKLMSRP
jgi:AcrR family transcriptional regulator